MNKTIQNPSSISTANDLVSYSTSLQSHQNLIVILKWRYMLRYALSESEFGYFKKKHKNHERNIQKPPKTTMKSTKTTTSLPIEDGLGTCAAAFCLLLDVLLGSALGPFSKTAWRRSFESKPKGPILLSKTLTTNLGLELFFCFWGVQPVGSQLPTP